MLVTPHAVAGATAGKLIGNPLVAIPVAIASHFILDRVPHWQETLPPYTPHVGTWIRTPIDVALSLYLVKRIARSSTRRSGSMWMGAVAAAAPDADVILPLVPLKRDLWRPLDRYLHWHMAIQRETDSLWGLAPQIALVIACLLLSRV